MSLFSALNTSTNGLRYTHDALGLLSQNVANASNPNYVRREYVFDQGLQGSTIRRALEPYVQRQMWRESANSGYSSAQSDIMSQLDQLYGSPDSKTNLSSSYNAFYSAFQALRSDPSSSTQQSTLLSTAKLFASRLNSMSDNVQALRTGVEEAIGSATLEADHALQSIAELNRQITHAGSLPDPSLLDARDQAIKTLSGLLDVTITQAPDGGVSITTSNGNTLLDASGARSLSFDSHAPLDARSTYQSGSASRTVGTISLTSGGVDSVDLIAAGAIKSGRLAGLIDARDHVLVAAQAQLDDIAAGLSSALSDTDRASTAVPGGQELDLTGWQPGNRIKLTYRDSSGVDHKVTIIRVEDSSALPLDNSVSSDPNDTLIGISFAGGVVGAKAGLQSALNSIGSGLAINTGTGGALQITATGSASVTALSARVTATTMTGSGTGLPFFVDGDSGSTPFTDSLDGGPQRVGFAARIAVHPSLLTTSSYLTIYQSPANAASDPSRPTDLIDRLEKTGLESSQNANLGLGGTMVPLAQLIKQTLQVQANDIQRSASMNDTQKTIQAALEKRFSSTSGVELDQELSDMTQLQNIYTANARVLSAVKDMFDVLMRI